MGARIVFHCRCGKELSIGATDATRELLCPGCGKSVPVPRTPSGADKSGKADDIPTLPSSSVSQPESVPVLPDASSEDVPILPSAEAPEVATLPDASSDATPALPGRPAVPAAAPWSAERKAVALAMGGAALIVLATFFPWFSMMGVKLSFYELLKEDAFSREHLILKWLGWAYYGWAGLVFLLAWRLKNPTKRSLYLWALVLLLALAGTYVCVDARNEGLLPALNQSTVSNLSDVMGMGVYLDSLGALAVVVAALWLIALARTTKARVGAAALTLAALAVALLLVTDGFGLVRERMALTAEVTYKNTEPGQHPSAVVTLILENRGYKAATLRTSSPGDSSLRALDEAMSKSLREAINRAKKEGKPSPFGGVEIPAAPPEISPPPSLYVLKIERNIGKAWTDVSGQIPVKLPAIIAAHGTQKADFTLSNIFDVAFAGTEPRLYMPASMAGQYRCSLANARGSRGCTVEFQVRGFQAPEAEAAKLFEQAQSFGSAGRFAEADKLYQELLSSYGATAWGLKARRARESIAGFVAGASGPAAPAVGQPTTVSFPPLAKGETLVVDFTGAGGPPTGWQTLGAGEWRVSDKTLHVTMPRLQQTAYVFGPVRPWRDYAMECDMQLDWGACGPVICRDANGACIVLYLILDDAGNPNAPPRVSLERHDVDFRGGGVSQGRSLAQKAWPLSKGVYHRVRLEARGNKLRALIDGEEALTAVDERQVATGGIGFAAHDANFKPGSAHFKNVRVMSLAEAGTSADVSVQSLKPAGEEWIVLSCRPAGRARPNLCLIKPDGKTRVWLTNDASCSDIQPKFSPNGRRMVFGRMSEATEKSGVWTCDVNGANARQLAAMNRSVAYVDFNSAGSPVWVSPSMVYFSYWTANGQCEVRRVSVDGGDAATVFPISWIKGKKEGLVTDVSRDGQRLFMVAQAGGWAPTLDVFTSDISGKSIQAIYEDGDHDHRDNMPLVSPKGDAVAWCHYFTAGANHDPEYFGVALASLDASGRRQVEMSPERESFVMPLAWSPSGDALLCARIRRVPGQADCGATLFLMNDRFQALRTVCELENWDWSQIGQWGRMADWAVVPMGAFEARR